MSREPVDLATVAALIEDAAAAPSLHNAQPWAFRYARRTGVLHLYADLERALPHTDPDDRGLHIGCGAALFNLRAAAAGRDLTPTVRLLPAPASPNLLAEIVLQGTGPPDDELARLAPAIRRRHSSRHPFQDKELPPAATAALCTAARAEGCELLFPSAWHVQSILELVRDAEGRELIDPEVRGETVRWTRTEPYSGGGAVDGIPGEAFGPRRRGASVPVRDFAVGRPVPGAARRSSRRARTSLCSERPRTCPPTGCAPVRHWNEFFSRPRWRDWSPPSRPSHWSGRRRGGLCAIPSRPWLTCR